MNVYIVLVTACWIAFLGYWLVSSFGVKKSRRSRTDIVAMLLRIGGLGLVFFLLQSSWFSDLMLRSAASPSIALGSLGVVLCALGIGFAAWARVHLGRNWGMPMAVKEDAELVTTGPYAFVRHPIYTGVLLAMLGTAFVAGLWYVAVIAIFGVYFVYSARTEEKRLLHAFPDGYSEYMRRTKMLIPFAF